MASCVLCASLLGANRSKPHLTTSDEARNHATQHLMQTKHFDDENCNSLDQEFEQCFPNFVVTPARKQKKIVVKKEGRRSLLHVCHTVLGRRISKASPRVTCHKCESEIILCGKKTGLQFGVAINHASGHLGIGLFVCRKCGRTFGNKSSLCAHLRMAHSLRCLSEYFTDKTSDFIEQIMKSIEQCFTEGNNGPSDEKARMTRFKDEAIVRSHTKGSKLAVERQLLCYHLIRQLAGEDGKIQCRLCLKRIYIKQASIRKDGFRSIRAMDHALFHLKKPLFRCKVCSNVRHTCDSLRLHLKSAHALPLMNNYVALVDEFHTGVLDMLRKCYAEEPGN